MKSDAELRMNVYQEGQRALSTGTPCPYTDWRAGTWMKGLAAARAHQREMMSIPEVVACGVCGTPTRMLGTKRCDRCWELERRIRHNPDLARKILDNL